MKCLKVDFKDHPKYCRKKNGINNNCNRLCKDQRYKSRSKQAYLELTSKNQKKKKLKGGPDKVLV